MTTDLRFVSTHIDWVVNVALYTSLPYIVFELNHSAMDIGCYMHWIELNSPQRQCRSGQFIEGDPSPANPAQIDANPKRPLHQEESNQSNSFHVPSLASLTPFKSTQSTRPHDDQPRPQSGRGPLHQAAIKQMQIIIQPCPSFPHRHPPNPPTTQPTTLPPKATTSPPRATTLPPSPPSLSPLTPQTNQTSPPPTTPHPPHALPHPYPRPGRRKACGGQRGRRRGGRR